MRSRARPMERPRAQSVSKPNHERLRHCDHLAGMGSDFVGDFLAGLSMLMLPQGTEIAKEGDTAEKLMCLSTGEVEVVTGENVSIVWKPSILGYIGVDGRWTSTLRAVSNCDCRVIGMKELTELLDQYPFEKSKFSSLIPTRGHRSSEPLKPLMERKCAGLKFSRAQSLKALRSVQREEEPTSPSHLWANFKPWTFDGAVAKSETPWAQLGRARPLPSLRHAKEVEGDFLMARPKTEEQRSLRSPLRSESPRSQCLSRKSTTETVGDDEYVECRVRKVRFQHLDVREVQMEASTRVLKSPTLCSGAKAVMYRVS